MGDESAGELVVRRSGQGWRVGDQEVDDLTGAMVLADLLAGDLELAGEAPQAEPANPQDEAARLAVTVAQLEHALAARVRIEQAIGVLAERHRLRPREAFDLLRSAARADGQKVTELAGSVVDSASNPLLPLPATLTRQTVATRQRGLSPRHARARS
jgi:ANTAR domain-containing protein